MHDSNWVVQSQMAKEQEEAEKVEEQGSIILAIRKGRPPLSRSPPKREMQSLSPSEPRKRGRPPLSRSSPRREIQSLSPFEPRKSGRSQLSQSPPRKEMQSLSPSKSRKRGRLQLSRSPPRREMQSLPPPEPRKRGRPSLSRTPPRREMQSLSSSKSCKRGRLQLSRSPPKREMQSLSPFVTCKRGRPPLSRSPPRRELQSLSPSGPRKRGRSPLSPSPPRKEIQSLSPSEPRKKRGRPRKQTPESPQPSVNLHSHLELVVAECDRLGFLVEPGSLVENSSRSLVETDSEQNADIGVSDGRNGDEDHQELPISNFQDATEGWELLSLVEGVHEYAESEKPKSPATTGVELIDQMVEDGTALISPPPINVVADVKETVATVGGPVNSVEQQDARDFPFAKCSPVWQYIELMDIFEKFPQRPHFGPLVDCSEETREGVAVAKMLHFASLAEDISILTETTSRGSAKRIAGKLAEFEELGFDVKAARARLSEWLAERAEVEELEAAWCRVDFHAMWSFDRALEIEGNISEIDEKVKVLEKRRASLMAKAAGIDFKISKLQEEVSRTRQAIHRRQ